jgi:2-keto-3-deoxy-L-rhamnonate aldolase RhmA
MRPNLAKRKLLEGGVISGPSISFPSPEIVQQALSYEFDFLWIEWQHGGWSEQTLSAALSTCVNAKTTPIVRLPLMDPFWIARILDLGALGIIIPMVETAEQCERIVQAAKFPPRGGRSATGFRTALHAGNDYFDYVEHANDEILVIVMVETPTGVGNVREMMAVPDVDCVLIGPYDLSRSVGAASMDDELVQDLVADVAAASKETGVAAGYVTGTVEQAQQRVDQGFRLVTPGHDLSILRNAFESMKPGCDTLTPHGDHS